METPHVNVMIATPGHSLMAQYVQSLLETTNELNKNGISWTWLNRYASHVGDAREVTVGGPDPQDARNTKPLKGAVTYDKIIWIDSDIAWTPQQFMKLYESDKDVISGAYLQSNGSVVVYPEMLKPPYQYQEFINKFDLEKVAAVGFGFLAVKQGVFENLSRPWFQTAYVKQPLGPNGEDIDFPLLGEDYSWCERVRRLGYDIWVDPTVRVTHHKMMKLTWEGIQS